MVKRVWGLLGRLEQKRGNSPGANEESNTYTAWFLYQLESEVAAVRASRTDRMSPGRCGDMGGTRGVLINASTSLERRLVLSKSRMKREKRSTPLAARPRQLLAQGSPTRNRRPPDFPARDGRCPEQSRDRPSRSVCFSRGSINDQCGVSPRR